MPVSASAGSKPVDRSSIGAVLDSSSDEVERYPGEVLDWKNTLMATRDDVDDARCFALLYMTVSPLVDVDVPERLTDVAWDYSNCNVTPNRVVLYERQWDERDAASVEEIVAGTAQVLRMLPSFGFQWCHCYYHVACQCGARTSWS